jgi:hypothetical protein
METPFRLGGKGVSITSVSSIAQSEGILTLICRLEGINQLWVDVLLVLGPIGW